MFALTLVQRCVISWKVACLIARFDFSIFSGALQLLGPRCFLKRSSMHLVGMKIKHSKINMAFLSQLQLNKDKKDTELLVVPLLLFCPVKTVPNTKTTSVLPYLTSISVSNFHACHLQCSSQSTTKGRRLTEASKWKLANNPAQTGNTEFL